MAAKRASDDDDPHLATISTKAQRLGSVGSPSLPPQHLQQQQHQQQHQHQHQQHHAQHQQHHPQHPQHTQHTQPQPQPQQQPPPHRLSLPNSDFSGSVKRKLADSKRTGQACDRCKVRKIRCDGRPEGCTPCEQNRTQCRTTDRITGRATVRGHAEAMESENSYLRAHIADLQQQLKDLGVDPRPPPPPTYSNLPWPSTPSTATLPADSQAWPPALRRTSTSPLPGYAPATAAPDAPDTRSLPHFKFGSIGDNYLGVAPGDSLLSHIRGTSLSIFGTEINISDYIEEGSEYEASPMSYTSLVKFCTSGQHVDPVPLPPYESLREWATWYLRSLNPYTMLVHKPAMMELIWRLCKDPSFTPTSAETAMVHMMLATIKYQIAVRNNQQGGLMDESHDHYRYACSFYKELILGQQNLPSVQVLAMICHHVRNFPKPGAAWLMTALTFLFALENGLHRSVKNWSDATSKLSKLEIEMRKRIFWTLHGMQMNLAGKLGRPMSISNEDIDVEFPEPMKDCLPGEEAELSPFHQCSFQIGIQVAKHSIWQLDLYKTIYAIRYSPRSYEESLKRLEAGIRQWKEELPYELRDPAHASPDDHIFALYLEYWYQEFQLLLHHPAVCRSVDPALLASNLDKCLHASQKMLLNCTEMTRKKSIDIVWINTVVYIAAIFTTLFISSMRKDLMSPTDMTRLKSDMALWISVLSECSPTSGPEKKLENAISKIVNQTLNNINESIVKRTATESLAHAALQTPQQSAPSSTVYDNSGYNSQYPTTSNGTTDPSLTQEQGYASLAESGNVSHSYNLGSSMTVPQQSNNAFDQQPYIKVDEDTGMNATHAAALAAAASGSTSQPPSDSYTYANGMAQVPSNGHTPTYAINGFTPQDWRQWTRTYMQQPIGPPGEYLNTATTLMALGGREGTSQDGGPGQESQVSMVDPNTPGHFHWPGVAFPGTANGNSGHQ